MSNTYMLLCTQTGNAAGCWDSKTEAVGFANVELTDAPDDWVVLEFDANGMATEVVWPAEGDTDV